MDSAIRRLGLLLAVTFWPSTAYAYIDPSAGALILQALLAGVAAVSVFFGRIKSALKRIFGMAKVKQDKGSLMPPSDDRS